MFGDVRRVVLVLGEEFGDIVDGAVRYGTVLVLGEMLRVLGERYGTVRY